MQRVERDARSGRQPAAAVRRAVADVDDDRWRRRRRRTASGTQRLYADRLPSTTTHRAAAAALYRPRRRARTVAVVALRGVHPPAGLRSDVLQNTQRDQKSVTNTAATIKI